MWFVWLDGGVSECLFVTDLRMRETAHTSLNSSSSPNMGLCSLSVSLQRITAPSENTNTNSQSVGRSVSHQQRHNQANHLQLMQVVRLGGHKQKKHVSKGTSEREEGTKEEEREEKN